MKAICLESTYLLEDKNTKVTEKGKIYTIVDAAKNPLPKITRDGRIVNYAKGWWYQFEETGDMWHHQERFKILESIPKVKTKMEDPHKGATRIVLPKVGKESGASKIK
jgi:hypothetical protein